MENDLSFDYVEEVNSSLECAICKSAFYNPTLTPCQHVFCSLCITRAMELSPTCPIDRSPLTLEDLMEAPRLVKQLVDELKVICSNCEKVFERGLLEIHLRECKKEKVDLKGKGKELLVEEAVEEELINCKWCSEKVLLSTSSSHQSTCAISRLSCTYCSLSLTRQLLPSHLLLCPCIPIPCPHAAYGCTARIPRSLMMEEHLEVICAYEPIKDFLFRYESRIGEVESENSMLRRRCEGLEEDMKDMREVLDGIKNGMGSYWGPTIGLKREEENVVAVPIPAQTISRSRDLVIERLGEADVEEFFTPPLSTSIPTPIIPTPIITSNSLPSPSPSFAPFPVPSSPLPSSSALLPPIQSTFVPFTSFSNPEPLPLPSVLSYLSNSIESLSTALLTLEENQSLNLMNETLRIQEDIGSIRGVVHGMRMQMHHLMMEISQNNNVNNRFGMMNTGGFSGGGGGMRPRMDHSTSSDGGADSNSDDDNSSGSNSNGGSTGLMGAGAGRFRYYNNSLPPPIVPLQQQQVRMGMGTSPPYPVIYPMGGGGMKL